MQNFLILFLVGVLLSACVTGDQSSDETRRPTRNFQDWVDSNMACPKAMGDDPRVQKDQSHTFTQEVTSFVDSDGSEAGFVTGNARYRSHCRVRTERTRTVTTRVVEPAKQREVQVTPKGQPDSMSSGKARLVPMRRKSKALDQQAPTQPGAIQEPTKPTLSPPKSILPDEPEADPIDCMRQPNGECLWIK